MTGKACRSPAGGRFVAGVDERQSRPTPAWTKAGHASPPVRRPGRRGVGLGAWQSGPLWAVLGSFATGSGDAPEPDDAYRAADFVGFGLAVAELAVLAGRPRAAHLTAGGGGALLIGVVPRSTGHGTPGRQYNSATVRRKTAVERS
jgi:hypothetical protein